MHMGRKLYNYLELPVLGFGTYKIPDGQPVIEAVTHAMEAGYRYIDTASFYGNEHGIGQALKAVGTVAEDVLIATKVWNSEQGYRETHQGFEESRDKLGRIDIYLIHWPVKERFVDTWKAMEEIHAQGLVKAIGVCNFQIHHMETLLAQSRIKPMINQIEMHPHLVQEKLAHWCREQEILVQAWRPLMNGEVNSLPVLQELAQNYRKTPAQVALRWLIQKGAMPLPKSVTPSRITENIDVLDFELSREEVYQVDACNQDRRLGPDPDNFSF